MEYAVCFFAMFITLNPVCCNLIPILAQPHRTLGSVISASCLPKSEQWAESLHKVFEDALRSDDIAGILCSSRPPAESDLRLGVARIL